VLGIPLALAGAPAVVAAPAGSHHEASAKALAFDEAIGLSENAPGLTGVRTSLEVRRRADSKLPKGSQNPQLQVMSGGRLPGAQEPGFEFQASLKQGWRLGRDGKKRQQAAVAESDAAAASLRATSLERSLGAARAWVDLHAAELRLAEARAALETDETLLALLERARVGGAATVMEVATARAAVAEAQLAVTELQGEVHDDGLRLARETGVRSGAPLRTRGAYPDPPLASEAELRVWFGQLEQLPEVVQHRLEARAARARAVEARAAKSTLLTTGVAVQRESNGDAIMFGVLGLQVPVVARNQRRVAAAEFEAGRADAAADQHAVEASARLQVALHDLHHTEERLHTLANETLPALDQQIAALERAAAAGEGTRIAPLRARHIRHLIARARIEAESRRVWARVEVWLYLQALEAGNGGSK